MLSFELDIKSFGPEPLQNGCDQNFGRTRAQKWTKKFKWQNSHPGEIDPYVALERAYTAVPIKIEKLHVALELVLLLC